MELRVLGYFLTTVREGTISRAAEALHITQPTLSRQLKELEEELGAKLFERGGKTISLTEDGLLLKRRAQEVIDLAEKTKRDFLCRTEDLSGEITVGCGELLAVEDLARWMADFRELNPNVRYNVGSATADYLKWKLDRGLIDLALLSEPVDVERYDFLRMRRKERWCAFVCDDSPLAEKEALTPDDLRGFPLLLPQRELIQRELAQWFGVDISALAIAATNHLPYTAAMMVKCKMGVALGIRLNVQYPGLVSVPLSPPLCPGSVIVWKKHLTMPQLLSAFIQYIRKQAKDVQ